MDRVGKKGTCESHFQFKKNYQNKSSSRTESQMEVSEILFYFYLLNLLSLIPEFLTVDFVGSNTKSALCDESYAWEPKTRDFVGFPCEIVNTYEYV